MDRRSLSKTEKNNHSLRHREKKKKARSPRGLQIKERSGNWHITGSVIIGERTIRIRKSTGLPATVENFEAADTLRDQIKAQVRDEIVNGKKENRLLVESASIYLRVKQLGKQDRGRIISLTMHLAVDWTNSENLKRSLINNKLPLSERLEFFIRQVKAHRLEFRNLRDIGLNEWEEFIEERHINNLPQTRQRDLNIIMPFIHWCHKKKWMDKCPEIERSEKILSKTAVARRRITEVTSEHYQLMIKHAAWHLKPQLAVLWSTGARLTSILTEVRVCDVCLDEGKETISFGKTKNGEPVIAVLHKWAVPILKEYQDRITEKLKRSEQSFSGEDLFFRDWKGNAYKHYEEGGGKSKSAFNGMKKKVVIELRSQGREDEAELISQFTPHWFRHRIATVMGNDTKSAMEQGGWKDERMLNHYRHDVTERRRTHVQAMLSPDT